MRGHATDSDLGITGYDTLDMDDFIVADIDHCEIHNITNVYYQLSENEDFTCMIEVPGVFHTKEGGEACRDMLGIKLEFSYTGDQ